MTLAQRTVHISFRADSDMELIMWLEADRRIGEQCGVAMKRKLYELFLADLQRQAGVVEIETPLPTRVKFKQRYQTQRFRRSRKYAREHPKISGHTKKFHKKYQK